jgi:type II secretory pathway pseudopilin PulG
MAVIRSNSKKQRGYVLLAVMLLVTLMLLTLSIELPRIAQQIRREKEEELIHRGNEYKNAIKKFYRKNGRYPLTLDDLEKGNNMRFLRKRYKDPFTGKDDWRLLHVGEVQVNISGGGTSFGTTGSSGPGLGNAGGTGSGTTGGSGSITPGAGPGTTGGTGPGGTGGPGSGTGFTDISGGGSVPLSTGGPIIGVASTKKDTSIKTINDKDHYNEWLFFYDPRLEQQQQQVGQPGINPPGSGKKN